MMYATIELPEAVECPDSPTGNHLLCNGVFDGKRCEVCFENGMHCDFCGDSMQELSWQEVK
jgi:hypothetical protein